KEVRNPTTRPTLHALSPRFLHRRGHHRRLHSFPTRRSSDLRAAIDVQPGRGGRRVAHPQQGGGATLARGPAPIQRGVVAGPRARDRKSTRLNSSHVAISYAVFCLKKKRRSNAR